MLSDKDAAANIAVKDIETARKFYEDILGLTQVAAEGQELIVFRSGNSRINVYQSQYAGTNQATAVTWVVVKAWKMSCGRSRPRASPSSTTTCRT